LPSALGDIQWYTVARSARDVDAVLCLYAAADGRIWIGTLWNGLLEYDGSGFRRYQKEEGLNHQTIHCIGEDNGALWLGIVVAVRFARNGPIGYNHADGLGPGQIIRIVGDQKGQLHAIDQDSYVSQFDGVRFVTARPKVPESVRRSGWGFYNRAT